MTKKTTVVLVDDHPVFRKGLRMLLEEEHDFTVVGEADDGEKSIALITELQPEIAVLDISMPGLSGIEVAERISTECPNTRIVALSIHSEKRFVEDMLLAGAAGYILKQSVPEDLVNGIRTIISGDSFLSPSITSVVLSGFKTALSTGRTGGFDRPQINVSKLYPPQIPDNYVKRQGLVDKLEKSSRLPVILVIAPAGYGKSTTVNNWLQDQSKPYGWISLDETESDLRQFLHYFIHTIQVLFPGSLADSEKMVNSSNLPPSHIITASILQEVSRIEQEFFLVLDDIHVLKGKKVFDFLTELLRHPLLHLHFVIIGRRDPLLPIARLRGKRTLVELRSKDLRFSLEETRQYLDLMLAEANNEYLTGLLHRKMEGWVAGLRLAILSTDQLTDLEDRLDEFKRDSQYVQEYLLNEAFDNQTAALRLEIMKLSILDRFCGPLCEVVISTLEHDAKSVISGPDFLNELNQANLFMVSLDADNIWFRFHHLFKHLLLKQLQHTLSSEKIEELHRAAGVWFTSNGFIEEGIKHAIRGQDFDSAERNVQQNRHGELARDRWHVIEKWLSMFPKEMILSRPALLLAHAWVCHDRHRLHELAELVQRLELITGESPLEGPPLGELHFLKGVLNFWGGNSEGCLLCMATARDLLPDSYYLILGQLEKYEALAQRMKGNYLSAIEHLQAKVSNIYMEAVIFRSRLIASLSLVHFIEGDLYQAYDSAERLQIMSGQNSLAYTETWGYYLKGNVSLQLFDLEKAAYHFSMLTEKLYIMHTRAAIDTLAGLALTYRFSGQPKKAYGISEQLEEFSQKTEDMQLISVARSLRARLFLLDSNTYDAEKHLHLMSEGPVNHILFIWLELPDFTRVRVLLSIGSDSSLQQASGLLSKLREQAGAEKDTGHLLEIFVLEAAAAVKMGDREEALVTLNKAVALAAIGGWIRPFIESGPPIIELLSQLQPESDELKRHIEAIFRLNSKQYERPEQTEKLETQLSHSLLEPLTDRELDILKLLARRLRNKEIGETLFISPETVKSHMKKIFSKLGAVDRRDVVEKAIKLKLLKKNNSFDHI